MKDLLKQCVGIDISKATFSACISKLNADQDIQFSKSQVLRTQKKDLTN